MAEVKNGSKYVRWQVFAWVIGIMTTLIGGAYLTANEAVSVSQVNKIDIAVQEVQYRNIETNLKEIKQLIIKQK